MILFLVDDAVRYIYYFLYDRVQLTKKKVVDGAAFVIIPFPSKWAINYVFLHYYQLFNTFGFQQNKINLM